MTLAEPGLCPLRCWASTALVLCSLLLASGTLRAQQHPAERLWQDLEQQQAQRQTAPAPLQTEAPARLNDNPALAALLHSPQERMQHLLLVVLNAVNQRDWFAADRALRQYAQIPQHDPALSTYVTASRATAAGDYDTAVAGYAQVLQASPQFTRGALDMARTLYADQRLRDAQEAFDRLRTQPLPPLVLNHIDEYQRAIALRERAQWSFSLSLVREDNVNSASTVVDPCALVFMGACLPNEPGQKIAATGASVEASLNKLWPLAGHHGILLRSINYGNHYPRHDGFDSFVSTSYLGYQYAAAHSQFQLLPLVELDLEGGREIYRALGWRAGVTRQIGERAQVEASVEYKSRQSAPRCGSRPPDFRQSAALFGQYVLPSGWLAYGQLIWRESEARQPIFAYREQALRLGAHKSFGDRLTLNMALGWRQKRAEAANAFFDKLQRDRERSLYLSASLPAYGWQGWTPTLSYEYRDNRSSIAHAYNYRKNRLALGLSRHF